MHYDEYRRIAHLIRLIIFVVNDLEDAETPVDEKAAVHYYTEEFFYRRGFARLDTQSLQCKIVA